MTAKISAIVLAAGTSSRMGKQNKLCLPFQNTTILNRVISQILDADVDEVVTVLGHERNLVQNCFDLHPKIRLVENKNFLSGMTSSIKVGVNAASETSDAFLICLSDMPYILTQDYNHIIHSFQCGKSILVPFFKGKKGNPILFSSHFKNEILMHSKPEGCRDIVRNNSNFVEKIEMSTNRIFMDIDKMSDLER